MDRDWNGRAFNGSVCFRSGTSGGLLGTRGDPSDSIK
jgi:hypothetical protein